MGRNTFLLVAILYWKVYHIKIIYRYFKMPMNAFDPGLVSQVGKSIFRLWFVFMLECGSYMAAKKKTLSILALWAFKHVDSCFQYLSDKEVQRKPYNDKTVHDFDISFLPSTMFSFLQPWFNVIWRQLSHLCAKMFSDFPSCWAGIMWIFPVRKPYQTTQSFPCWEVVLPTWMFSWSFPKVCTLIFI